MIFKSVFIDGIMAPPDGVHITLTYTVCYLYSRKVVNFVESSATPVRKQEHENR